jgi:hypothetical protein
MKRTKKGNQWYFGMKAQMGVDARWGLVHSVVGTAANVNEVRQAGALLHGHEQTRMEMPANKARTSGPMLSPPQRTALSALCRLSLGR